MLSRAGMPQEASITRNFGSGTGLRVNEKALLLSDKNRTVVRPGMVFAVSMGMSNIALTDVKNKSTVMSKLHSYAVLVADTVVVTQSEPTVVTSKLPSEKRKIVYQLADEEEEDEDMKAASKRAAA
ncbi:M24 family metallopeptidase, partial [archaeon]